MMNFALITALLCIYSWISVSVSEFHSVEVQPGQEVTLMCSNFSSIPAYMFWFKLDNRSNSSCISYMLTSDGNASYCDGFQNGKFRMTSNTTTHFLEIKQVDLSDSGLYFCGFKSNGNSVIVSGTYSKVQATRESVELLADGTAELMRAVLILGGLTVFLVIVFICLAVVINKLQKADNEEQSPQQRENVDSAELKDAALSLYLTTIRNRRPESERQVETRVVYAASR